MKTIVTEHRASHGFRPRPLGNVITRLDKHAGFQSDEFKPFPPGTVRGPYRNPQTVQFLVQTRNGWVPFARGLNDEAEARQAAEAFALKHVNT